MVNIHALERTYLRSRHDSRPPGGRPKDLGGLRRVYGRRAEAEERGEQDYRVGVTPWIGCAIVILRLGGGVMRNLTIVRSLRTIVNPIF